MSPSTRAQQQYTAANLSLSWDCVLLDAGGDLLSAQGRIYRAERGGTVVAVVQITCLDRLPGETLALPGVTRQALTDAAQSLGAKAAMHAWVHLADNSGTAWAVDVLKLKPYPVRDRCHRVPLADTRQITMPVEPPNRERVLWHCECGARHELADMCHAVPSPSPA